MNIKKTDLSKQTDELKQLILDNPDLPIVVLTETEVVADDSYGYWYGSNIKFNITEIIEYQGLYDNYFHVYEDREELEEKIANDLADDERYCDLSDEQFDAMLKIKMKEYEPMWTKVIAIYSMT